MGIIQPLQRAGIKYMGGDAASLTNPIKAVLASARQKYAGYWSGVTTGD